MGIRITSSTWRKPLRLIDSWLPSDPSPTPTGRAFPQLMQRFARAGWLGQVRPPPAAAHRGPHESMLGAVPSRSCCVRVLATAPGARSGPRLVISGRMADVCAELERLEALERQESAAFVCGSALGR
jgi:hypothetical protein